MFTCGQGPLTPLGGWTGVLVGEIPGQRSFFNLDQVAIWTPKMYGLSAPLDETMPMAFSISPIAFIFENLSKISIFFISQHF